MLTLEGTETTGAGPARSEKTWNQDPSAEDSWLSLTETGPRHVSAVAEGPRSVPEQPTILVRPEAGPTPGARLSEDAGNADSQPIERSDDLQTIPESGAGQLASMEAPRPTAGPGTPDDSTGRIELQYVSLPRKHSDKTSATE